MEKTIVLKHKDYHFGESSNELFLKWVCWTVSLLVIFFEYQKSDVVSVASNVALSMLVFALSCGVDIYASIKKKKDKYAKTIYRIILVLYIYTGASCALIVLGYKKFPNEIVYIFWGVFLLVYLLLVADWFLIDHDEDSAETCDGANGLGSVSPTPSLQPKPSSLQYQATFNNSLSGEKK